MIHKQGKILSRVFAAIVFVALLMPSACQKEVEYQTLSGEVHGTYYKITYSADAGLINPQDLTDCFRTFELSLSTFQEKSVISRINRNEADVVPDSLFLTVFNRGLEISRLTDGAFDMTVAPLVNLWGFGFKKSENVTDEHVREIMRHVGYDKIRLEDGRIVKSDTAVMLDAAAIAKGYSCDIVANFLSDKGSKNYMVEIGGEIVTHGLNPQGQPWRIGITQPTDDNAVDNPTLQAKVSLGDIGTATSGNYRQFYYKDGKRYSHTINPHTGYPVEHNLLSATVFASDCMTADALATAFMVMGLDKACAFVENQTLPVTAYFIYTDEDDHVRTKTVGPDSKQINLVEMQ
ncbi:MAG: FAD:protein FMN transferase [Paludibacteraceae bacterium]|nr:FAD:protein FMN transferase [Paludibacteraceae bacterium]